MIDTHIEMIKLLNFATDEWISKLSKGYNYQSYIQDMEKWAKDTLEAINLPMKNESKAELLTDILIEIVFFSYFIGIELENRSSKSHN